MGTRPRWIWKRDVRSAAWSPNPANPPQYFDLPTKDGQVQPLVAKWAANSLLAMVGQYFPNLKPYRAIAMDVGDKDSIDGVNVDLDKELTRLGVPHALSSTRATTSIVWPYVFRTTC